MFVDADYRFSDGGGQSIHVDWYGKQSHLPEPDASGAVFDTADLAAAAGDDGSAGRRMVGDTHQRHHVGGNRSRHAMDPVASIP